MQIRAPAGQPRLGIRDDVTPDRYQAQ